MLAGGAKPATHYLQSHKHLCSIAFGVNLGLEPVTVSILPPASAADSPLLFKRIQCYKSCIWLSAGPSHDLVLNKSGHESINTALWFWCLCQQDAADSQATESSRGRRGWAINNWSKNVISTKMSNNVKANQLHSSVLSFHTPPKTASRPAHT